MRTLALAAVFAGACGGIAGVDTPDTAKLSGRPGGETFVPLSAAAMYTSPSSALIGLYPMEACGGGSPTTANSLRMAVQDDGSGMPRVAGVYTVGNGTRSSSASYSTTSGTTIEAMSGAIDITENTSAVMRGTFDLQLHDGSHVSGSFDACELSP